MNETKAIIGIVVGCAAIFAGFTIKQFYVGNILAVLGSSSCRPVARWKGRLLFVVVGAAFLFFGLAYFFFNAHK